MLGGGGILGEAWLTAVLAGIEQGDGFDPCACGSYVGTSPGRSPASSAVATIEPAEVPT